MMEPDDPEGQGCRLTNSICVSSRVDDYCPICIGGNSCVLYSQRSSLTIPKSFHLPNGFEMRNQWFVIEPIKAALEIMYIKMFSGQQRKSKQHLKTIFPILPRFEYIFIYNVIIFTVDLAVTRLFLHDSS